MSGGPVLDPAGGLLGLVKATRGPKTSNLGGFVIPVGLLPKELGQKLKVGESTVGSRPVQRPALESAVAAAVNQGSRRVALVGLPGFGKTSLAIQCAQQFEAVIWVDLRGLSDARSIVSTVATRLGLDLPKGELLESVATMIRNRLEQLDGEHLIVFDDLWSPTAAQILSVSVPPAHPVLVTTGRTEAVNRAFQLVEVGGLLEDEASSMLEQVEDLELRLRLAALSHGWPLLLTLIIRALDRHRTSFGQDRTEQAAASVVQRLENAGVTSLDREQDRSTAIQLALEFYLEQLSARTRERFRQLALVLGGRHLSLHVLSAVWRVHPDEAAATVAELLDLRLLEDDAEGTFALHSAIASVLSSQRSDLGPADWAEVCRRLIPLASSNDAYIARHLPAHLNMGGQPGLALELILRPSWRRQVTRVTGTRFELFTQVQQLADPSSLRGEHRPSMGICVSSSAWLAARILSRRVFGRSTIGIVAILCDRYGPEFAEALILVQHSDFRYQALSELIAWHLEQGNVSQVDRLNSLTSDMLRRGVGLAEAWDTTIMAIRRLSDLDPSWLRLGVELLETDAQVMSPDSVLLTRAVAALEWLDVDPEAAADVAAPVIDELRGAEFPFTEAQFDDVGSILRNVLPVWASSNFEEALAFYEDLWSIAESDDEALASFARGLIDDADEFGGLTLGLSLTRPEVLEAALPFLPRASRVETGPGRPMTAAEFITTELRDLREGVLARNRTLALLRAGQLSEAIDFALAQADAVSFWAALEGLCSYGRAEGLPKHLCRRLLDSADQRIRSGSVRVNGETQLRLAQLLHASGLEREAAALALAVARSAASHSGDRRVGGLAALALRANRLVGQPGLDHSTENRLIATALDEGRTVDDRTRHGLGPLVTASHTRALDSSSETLRSEVFVQRRLPMARQDGASWRALEMWRAATRIVDQGWDAMAVARDPDLLSLVAAHSGIYDRLTASGERSGTPEVLGALLDRTHDLLRRVAPGRRVDRGAAFILHRVANEVAAATTMAGSPPRADHPLLTTAEFKVALANAVAVRASMKEGSLRSFLKAAERFLWTGRATSIGVETPRLPLDAPGLSTPAETRIPPSVRAALGAIHDQSGETLKDLSHESQLWVLRHFGVQALQGATGLGIGITDSALKAPERAALLRVLLDAESRDPDVVGEALLVLSELDPLTSPGLDLALDLMRDSSAELIATDVEAAVVEGARREYLAENAVTSELRAALLATRLPDPRVREHLSEALSPGVASVASFLTRRPLGANAAADDSPLQRDLLVAQMMGLLASEFHSEYALADELSRVLVEAGLTLDLMTRDGLLSAWPGDVQGAAVLLATALPKELSDDSTISFVLRIMPNLCQLALET